MDEFSIVDELKSRIQDPYPKTVSCGQGWNGLLTDLHNKLVGVDPHYTIFQVKEKFGSLQFYFEPSDPAVAKACYRIVSMYERLSERVCEVTGLHGSLMVRNGVYKTLHERFKNEGWENAPASRSSIQPVGVDSEQQ